MADIAALRLLTVVAVTGSLSQAAERLGVSQQAVSARLRALEATLGVDLAVRSARGTRLTPTGLLVAGWAQDLVAAADGLDRSVAALRAGHDDLTVAASLTVAEHLVPAWLVRLGAVRPDLRARVDAQNSAQVMEQVRRGRAALGLVETPDLPDDLTGVTVGHDEIVVVVHPDHPWASRRRIGPARLAGTALLVREPGSGTRRTLERALTDAGLTLAAPLAELTSALALRTTAAGGLGPTVLSALAVADDLATGRLVRVQVDGLRMSRPITAVWLGRHPSAATTALLDVIRSAPPGRVNHSRTGVKDLGTSAPGPTPGPSRAEHTEVS